MLTLSNGLSFFRAPLALLFLQDNPSWRLVAVFLAMLTDSIDGYLARRSRSTSRFGAILDPTMDKFFVFFSLTFLLLEGKILAWQMAAMLSRDFFLCLYGLYMLAAGRWKSVVFRAIRWGKATTALQFIVLMGLILDFSIPWYVFFSFLVMGWMAFVELFQVPRRTSPA